ncbi:hypothetical protein [Aurantibacter sp.]|uniref:hypothetical protein n=1 Tax=Aurantibacter sp. TaxID=2807103 RepID=UPI003263AC0C
MENTLRVKPPLWFWIISVIGLLWNLMGVGAYLADAFMSIEDLEALTQAQRELHEAQPAWVTACYAIAVWAGALGCVFLLMRKKWARPVLLVSLLGVIGQQIYMKFLSNTYEVYGGAAMLLPIMVIIIAVALVFFARLSDSKQWIL